MLAQNETGVILPVAAVAKIAHAAGALVHVDAVQAAAKIPIDARALGADFVTISGHKFHAPKGVGALMVRRGLKLTPLWYGGGQELGLRSGTEPVPSLAGLGVAADLGLRALAGYGRVTALRDRLETFLRDASPDISINGATQPRLGNTANVSFHGLMADAVVRALDEDGVCVSAGAACHSGRVEPTAVMKAMNKPMDAALGAVRFSLSRYTTEAEIDRAVGAVLDAVSGKARISL
jgi:cysteine desulfurase